MNLRDWREKRSATEELALPSGLTVKLRRFDLIDLVAEGQIPETLDALVRKATSEGFGINEARQFAPLVNAVARACLVEPAIGEQSDDEHITLTEIPFSDRLEIFQWANGAANALQSFRPESASTVEPAPDRVDVRTETE